MTWREAEQWLAARVGGSLVSDRERQLTDIDVVDGEGLTYSVKVSPAVARYNNFSFERELERSDTGERRPGNWALCQASRYVIVVPPWDVAFVWDSAVLRPLVEAKPYPIKSLTAAAEATNAGRVWDRSWSLIIPVRDLAPSASTWRLGLKTEGLLPWPS